MAKGVREAGAKGVQEAIVDAAAGAITDAAGGAGAAGIKQIFRRELTRRNKAQARSRAICAAFCL